MRSAVSEIGCICQAPETEKVHPLRHACTVKRGFRKALTHSSHAIRAARMLTGRRSSTSALKATSDEEWVADMSLERQRLFSNLDTALKHEKGSVLGASILIAGTTIGAGILALPYTTQSAGFVPSTVAIFGTYVFSIVTGLLLAECNINLMCELGQGGVSVTSISQATLGSAGARLSSAAYMLLHYSLLVAYTAKSGELWQQILGNTSDGNMILTSLAFCGALACMCYFLKPNQLDRANGVLLAGVLLSFAALVWELWDTAHVNPENLNSGDWTAVPATLPVLSLAFVYQNVVPVVCSKLEGDISKVRQAIIGGLSIPLAMFIVWNGAILCSLNADSEIGNKDPLVILTEQSPSVGLLIQVFSLLAIATSYIGFVLGLSDFLADLMKMPSGQQQRLPYILTVAPPFVLAALFPDLFFKALDLAGTYGVLSLFGVLPAASVWMQRYGSLNRFSAFRVVPGGKVMLLVTGGIAGSIIVNQLFHAVVR